MRQLFFLLFIFLTACTTQPSSLDEEITPRLFTLYSADSTENRVPRVYDCATRAQLGLVSRTFDIDEADISLRIGAVENGYKIGEIELVIIGNAENPTKALTRVEVSDIFTGKIVNWAEVGGEDALITLWVYDNEDDLQSAFNETLLKTETISTMARQAQNTREMRREIAQDAYAIGISTQADVGTNLRVLYSIEQLPILAVSKDEPEEIVFSVIRCLQGN